MYQCNDLQTLDALTVMLLVIVSAILARKSLGVDVQIVDVPDAVFLTAGKVHIATAKTSVIGAFRLTAGA